MYCTKCGTEIREASDRFCAQCGQATSGAARTDTSQCGPTPRLERDMANKKIAGVCAGLANHLGWDVTLMRVAFLAAVVVNGFGLLAYLIAWICMPRSDAHRVVVA